MIERALTAAKEHAAQQAPLEACGLIYVAKGRARYLPCQNVAERPEMEFAISPVDYARADDLGDVIAVVHSHPGGSAAASSRDLAAHAVSGLDWYIIGVAGEVEHYPAKHDQVPLFGRTFQHGVTDCYTFIRDWFRQERGIALPDFYRADNWWEKGQDLYTQNFALAGFAKVESGLQWQAGDVLVMGIGSAVGNHGAIYLPDNKIAHHLFGRLSCVELLSDFYRDRIIHHLRYSAPD